MTPSQCEALCLLLLWHLSVATLARFHSHTPWVLVFLVSLGCSRILGLNCFRRKGEAATFVLFLGLFDGAISGKTSKEILSKLTNESSLVHSEVRESCKDFYRQTPILAEQQLLFLFLSINTTDKWSVGNCTGPPFASD